LSLKKGCLKEYEEYELVFGYEVFFDNGFYATIDLINARWPYLNISLWAQGDNLLTEQTEKNFLTTLSIEMEHLGDKYVLEIKEKEE